MGTICAVGQGQDQKAGQLYFTWGYHNDAYTRSTIHFENHSGDDYDFTFYDAKAKDKPDMKNLFGKGFSIPQYVMNLGYFLPNKPEWGIELSWDHLKYVVIDNQVMHMKGEIRGEYYDQDTLVTHDFVHFEHTDGNNYLCINVVRRFSPWSNGFNKKQNLNFMVKAGAGALVPKTNSTILGEHNDDAFKVSGVVVTAGASVRYTFFKYVYLEGAVKGGFADYTSAKLPLGGRAKHTFFSVQGIYSIGVTMPVARKAKDSDS